MRQNTCDKASTVGINKGAVVTGVCPLYRNAQNLHLQLERNMSIKRFIRKMCWKLFILCRSCDIVGVT